MEDDKRKRATDVLRWIALLPGAVAGGWAMYILMNVVARWSFSMVGADPNWLPLRIVFGAMGSFASGAGFVCIGAKIAPAQQRAVAYVLCGLALVLSGFLLFPAVMMRDWWAVCCGVLVIAGAGVTALAIAGDKDFG